MWPFSCRRLERLLPRPRPRPRQRRAEATRSRAEIAAAVKRQRRLRELAETIISDLKGKPHSAKVRLISYHLERLDQ